MDNVYFKKLPSETLPSVRENNVVIVETASGKLYWCDSGGAKRLMSAVEEHPVDSYYLQFYGEPTPAAKYGGTWTQDSDYAGRTLVGAGTGFAFGATGGSADAVVVAHTHKWTEMVVGNGGIMPDGATVQYGYAGTAKNLVSIGGDGNWKIASAGQSGTGKNWPPYKVITIWKRTA